MLEGVVLLPLLHVVVELAGLREHALDSVHPMAPSMHASEHLADARSRHEERDHGSAKCKSYWEGWLSFVGRVAFLLWEG